MAGKFLRRFCKPEILRSIDPLHLRTFLEPFEEALGERVVRLPSRTRPEDLNIEQLIGVLLDPWPTTPPELIDALHHVNELATPEGSDALRSAAAQRNVRLTNAADASAADIAVQVWMACPDLVREMHTERLVMARRSFKWFQGRRGRPSGPPTPEVLSAMTDALDTHFAERGRGRGVHISMFSHENEIWFLIRRGEQCRREGILDRGRLSNVSFRPLVYDVVIYDRRLGEIGVNTCGAADVDITKYRRVFGEHMHGSSGHFPDGERYSLEPLRTRADPLGCEAIDAFEWVRLRELRMLWGGPYGDIEIRKSTDLLASMQARNRTIPSVPRLIEAVFEIKFKDSGKTRRVRLRPPNVAVYCRNCDAPLVELWLGNVGFALRGRASGDADGPLLVSA